MPERPRHAMRTHPISILEFLWRFLFLLIIPVARGFITALTGGLLAWLRGAWIDLLVVILILVLAYLKWHYFEYCMDRSGFHFTSGIFFKRNTYIPLSKICTLSTLRPIWLRPLRIVKLRLDTIARGPKRADLALYLQQDEAERLIALHVGADEPDGESAPSPAVEYRPPLLGVVFLSLFTSNSFLGILFISAFISQAGQLVGDQISGMILTAFQELARQIALTIPMLTAGILAIRLPPIAAGAAVLLLCGWLVAFLWNLLQTKGLCIRRNAERLQIVGGLLTEKQYSLRTDDLSFVDVRQSLLTRTLRLYSVYINAIGIGKDKSDIAAVIPFSTKERTMKKLTLLLPEYRPAPRQLKPNGGAVMKFLIDPLWPCVLIPAGMALGIWLLPNWTEILQFTGFMLELPALWFLGVRLMDFFTSGVARCGKTFALRYSKGYYLHTVVFSAEKIALINIRQSILQRGDNRCDLVVSTRAEGQHRHHIRNLGWDEVVALFDAGDDWLPADAGIPNWYERLFLKMRSLLPHKKTRRPD